MDILGGLPLNEELSEDYKKVSHKVKLMYKTLRKGRFKINVLIPNMVPFWTGFEMIEDGDELITYELPTKYYLIPGYGALSYKLVISEITINCEKYPGLADDIDVRSDILRRLSRKLNNALKSTFNEGEQVKVEMWRKPDISSTYEYMVDGDLNEQDKLIKKVKTIYKSLKEERLWDKPDEDFSEIVKKAPIVYRALKKGSVVMDISSWDIGRVIEPKKCKINYTLSDVYKIETDPFENNYNVKILIPTIKLDCPEDPDVNNSQALKLKVLDVVKKKFNNFDINIFLRATHFRLKHNGTWVNL